MTDSTFTWTAVSGGDWTTSGDWNLPGFPASITDQAAFTTPGNYTVAIAPSDPAITTDGIDLLANGVTLSIAGDLVLASGLSQISLTAGELFLNGGTLSGGVLDQSGGTLAVSNSSANVLDDVAVIGGLTLNNADVALTNGATVYADASQTTLGLISLTNSGLVFRQATPITVDQTIDLANSTLTFDNPGSTAQVTLAAGALLQGSGSLSDQIYAYSGPDTVDNQGTILATSSTFYINPVTFTNDGLINAINGAGVNIDGNLNRAWTNAADGTIEISGDGTLELSGPFSNAGLISVTGSTLNLDGTYNYGGSEATWTNTGTIEATTSTVNLAGDETVTQIGTLIHDASDTLYYTSGTLDNTGGTLNAATTPLLGLTLNGATILGGALYQAALGLTFTNNNNNTLSDIAVIGGLTLNNGDVALTNGATVYADASQTTLGLISLTNSGLVFRQATPITVDQTIDLANSTLTFDNPGSTATVTLAPGALLQGSGSLSDQIYAYSGPDTVDNQGTILATSSTFYINPVTFTNDGLINAINGAGVNIDGNLNRAWTNAADGTIEASGGGTVELSGPFSNAGLISVTGSTLNLDGTYNYGGSEATWTNTGTIEATTSTVNLAGDETVNQIGTLLHDASDTLYYTSGTLDNTGGTLNAATTPLLGLTLNGATIKGGALYQAALGLTFTNNNNNTLSDVAVIGGLTLNNAGLALTNGSTVYADASQTTLGLISLTNSTLVFRQATPITVDQTIDLANSTLTFDNPGGTATVTLAPGALLQGSGSLSDQIYAYSGPDTVDNQGTILASTGSGFSIDPVTFTNDGLINAINGAGINIDGNQNRAWTNAADGTIEASGGGTLELSGPFSNAGLISVTGSTLNLDGTYNYGGSEATWTNTGTIEATTSTVNIAGDETVNQIGTLIHDVGDTLYYTSGTLENTGGTLNAATTSLLGLVLNGATILGGALYQAALGLTFTGNGNNTLSDVAVIGGLTLNNAGLALTNGSTVYADASQTTLGLISLTNSTLVFRQATPITVDQTIDLANSTLTFDNPGSTATVTLAPGALLQGSGSLSDQVYGYAGPDTVDNQGTILATSSTFYINPVTFTNDGLINAINGASLNIDGGNDRAWTNNADGTIEISGGGVLELSGPFSNAGLFSASGSTLNLDASYNFGNSEATWTNTGTIEAATSTVNLAGDETVNQIGTLIHDASDTLYYTSGTLDNTGGTLNAATTSLLGLVLNGATIQGGALDASGLGLSFTGNSNNTLNNVSLINGFTVSAGVVNLIGSTAVVANGSQGGGLRVNGGIVRYAGASAYTVTGHAILDGGTLTWAAPTGTANVTVAAGALIDGAGYLYDNSFGPQPEAMINAGTIEADVQGASLWLSPTNLTNNGLLEATAQSTLEVERDLGRSWTNAASGTILGGIGSTLWLSGPFSNAGTIDATSGTLTLDGEVNGTVLTWTNTGVINVINETVLLTGDETVAQLGSINAVGSQFDMTGGTLDNTGGTLNGSSPLAGLQLQGATISGGTVDAISLGLTFNSGSNVLNNVALINNFAIGGGNVILNNSSVYADAGATTPGAIVVDNAALAFEGAASYGFNGALYLGGGAVDWIGTGGTANVTIGATAGVFGYGLLDTNLEGQNSTVNLVNDGVVDADAGQTLTIATSSFTNDGVVSAEQSASVSIQATDFTNLAAGVLTGGDYLVLANSGIALPGTVSTLDATVALTGSGAAFNGGGQGLAATLTDIGTGGALDLFTGVNLVAANSLSVQGALGLFGGKLGVDSMTLAASGVVAGDGTIVTTGTIVDDGEITAFGGTLDLFADITGTGGLATGPGATLKLEASAAPNVSFINGGGTLELGVSPAPLLTGTITGFAVGDVIQIDGFSGTAAALAGGVLTVTGPSSDYTLNLAGTYAQGFTAVTEDDGDTEVTLNAAPPLTIAAPGSLSATGGVGAFVSGVALNDGDGGTITVQAYVAAGELAAQATGGASVSGDGSDALTISGSETQVNAALATLGYEPAASATADTLTVSASDTTGASNGIAIPISVTPPLDILGPTRDETSFGQSSNLYGYSISDPNIPAGGTVTLTVASGGGLLSAPVTGASTISGEGSGTLVLTGSVNDLNSDLFGLIYQGPSGASADTLTLTLNDGITAPGTLVAQLVASPKPLLILPGTIAALANGLTPLDGMLIRQGGTDNPTEPMTVTLTDGTGILAVTQVAGTVSGSGTSTVILTGDAADINQDLASLSFLSATSGAGAILDTLSVTATAAGSTATGAVTISNASLAAPTAGSEIVVDANAPPALATNVPVTYIGAEGEAHPSVSDLVSTYVLAAPGTGIASPEQIALGIYNSGTEAIDVTVQTDPNAPLNGMSWQQAGGAPEEIQPGTIGYIGTVSGSVAGATETLQVSAQTVSGVILPDRRVTVFIGTPTMSGGGQEAVSGEAAPVAVASDQQVESITNDNPAPGYVPNTPGVAPWLDNLVNGNFNNWATHNLPFWPGYMPPPPPQHPPPPPVPPPPPDFPPFPPDWPGIVFPPPPTPPPPTPPPPPPTTPPPPASKTSNDGDVHITTFDGLHYDFQAVGEFVDAKSNIPGDSFEVQIRLQPWYTGASVSVITMAAVALGTNRVTFALNRASPVQLNGEPLALPANGTPYPLADGYIRQLSPTSWVVSYNTGETVSINNYGSYLDVDTTLPAGLPAGSVSGLDGTDSGNLANEFTLPNGTVLQQPLSSSELYTTWANAWRVTQGSSLLDYADGQTTATFSDPNFPIDSVQISSLPASVVQNAENLIAAAGITDPAAAHDALTDYLLTGDESFISSAANEQNVNPGSTPTSVTGTQNTTTSGVGIAALNATQTAGDGDTSVTFEIYRVGDTGSSQVVDFQAIAPDPGDLPATGYNGGVFPSGSVTLAANQSSIDVTVTVASLGGLPQATADIAIDTSTSGTPVIAPTASTIVTNPAPVEGPPAAPAFIEISNTGGFTTAGSIATLDLGAIVQNTAVGSIVVDLVNGASLGGDSLAGMLAQSDSNGISASGLGAVGTLTPGEFTPITLMVNTATVGAISDTIQFTASDTNSSGFLGSLGTLELNVTGQVTCFAAGTRIATPDGDRTVETLRPGETVLTHTGEVKAIRWLGRRTVESARHPSPALVWPIEIAAGAFGPGCPARLLRLSPDHAIFFDGVLIPARLLCNGTTIRQRPVVSVTYFHIELDEHAVVLADGLAVESYLETGCRAAFANGGRVADAVACFARHEQTAWLWETKGAAPLVLTGPALRRARAAIAAWERTATIDPKRDAPYAAARMSPLPRATSG